MSDGVRVAPAFVVALTAAVPSRLVKKLDGGPAVARTWAWETTAGTCTVKTDAGEVVTLTPVDGVVREASQAKCSCLLSPRCFHLLAVVSVLPVETSVTDAPSSEPAHEPTAVLDQTDLTAAQRRVAAGAWRVAADVLRAGARGTGAVLQAELLRVAHIARTEGLHRLANAATRVVADARDLRAERPEFALDTLVDDLLDLLQTAWTLDRAARVDAAWVGVARRPYAPVGSLRLVGLFCEPVIAQRGYAGVVSYVCDAEGRIWSVADVMPAEAPRAVTAYDATVTLGDASLTHRALAHEGLFVQSATGSRDGRLGAGAGVRAVRASGSTSWEDPGPAQHFTVPLGTQLDRAFAAMAQPAELRRRSDTWLFVKARVLGTDGRALWLETSLEGGTPPRPIRAIAPLDHPLLPYRDNLRMLARVPDLALWCIGDLVPDEPCTMSLLAVGLPSGQARLPASWSGRVNLGYDALQSAHFDPPARAEPVVVRVQASEVPDLFHAYRRAPWQVALHGTAAVPPSARGRIEQVSVGLETAMMPAGALALRRLVDACAERAAPLAIATAWLAAVVYVRAAGQVVQQARWG